MAEAIQILTTTPDKELAVRIAHELLEAQLAACVQISGPVESIYRWQRKVQSAVEWQCWIKTTRDRYSAVEQRIRGLHPYQVPEILAFPIVEGHLDYLQWLTQSLVEENASIRDKPGSSVSWGLNAAGTPIQRKKS